MGPSNRRKLLLCDGERGPSRDMSRAWHRTCQFLSVPGRRVVHPATTEHRRHDLHRRQLLRIELERITVEDDEVGEVAGEELAAPPFLAFEPGRIDARG